MAIDGHVGSAGFEHTEDPRHHLDGARQVDGDSVGAEPSGLDDLPGDHVAAAIEFGIADGLALARHRSLLGSCGCLRSERLHHRSKRDRPFGVVEARQRRQLVGREHLHPADRRLRIGDHGLQQLGVVDEELIGHGLVELICIEVEPDVDRIRSLDSDRKRETGASVAVDRAVPQRAAGRCAGTAEAPIRKQRVGEGRARPEPAPLLDVGHRGVFMVEHFGLAGLHVGEPVVNGEIVVDLEPKHERVDEHPDHRFYTIERGGTACGHDAEGDVPPPRVASNGKGEATDEHRVEGQPQTARDGAEVAAELGGEGVEVSRISVGCGFEPGRNHSRWGRISVEVGAPELCRTAIVVGSPLDVVRKRTDVRQRGLLVLDERLVGNEDLVEHVGRGPAVLEEVVVAPQHHVAIGTQVEDHDPHERRCVQGEAFSTVRDEPSLDRGFGIRIRRNIARLDQDVEVPAHDLDGTALVLPGEQRA